MKDLSCLLILVNDAFQAVNQLCSHFEAYRDVPKITELREKFKNIKQILKSHVFSDFSRYVILFDQKIKIYCNSGIHLWEDHIIFGVKQCYVYAIDNVMWAQCFALAINIPSMHVTHIEYSMD